MVKVVWKKIFTTKAVNGNHIKARPGLCWKQSNKFLFNPFLKSKPGPRLDVKICLQCAAFCPSAVFTCTDPVCMLDSIGGFFPPHWVGVQQRSRCNLICCEIAVERLVTPTAPSSILFPFSAPGLDWYLDGGITLEICLGTNHKWYCGRSSITVHTVFLDLKITVFCQHCMKHESFDHSIHKSDSQT